MKKVTSLLIGCSLMLAGAVMAQQPDDQSSKKEKKHAQEKQHTTEGKPGANANTAKPHNAAAMKEHAAPVNQRANANAQKRAAMKTEKGAATGTNVSGQATTTATTPVVKQHGQHRKEMKAVDANAKVSDNPAAATAVTGAPAISAASQQNAQVNAAGGGKKKPAPEQVQQIKAKHANFHAQPKPQQVPAVTYQQNYRIQGSDRWQGRQYDVFRSYHPERHDRHWYHSHFNRVVLIGGGYYYWNSGYWYPAWGYDSGNEYYAYDAPIYVGHAAEPPDRVIASVQAELQEMGYYKGEVDGLLGPLTREALAGYQADNGLTQTEMIDEPTLDSLGMS